VQHHDDVPLTPVATPASTPTPASAPVPAQPGADNHQPHKKKNKNDTSDHLALINRLNKPPHIIEFKGAALDRNERLKIIAAVALCESGTDPFSSINADSEFHHAPSSNLTYGHIVHIGLSYGIINFTQDSGGLGRLLSRMQAKDADKFIQTFGDNWAELITLTNSGIEVRNVGYASGQAHWNAIRHTKDGEQLAHLAANNHVPKQDEIRGKRVQPIAISVGGPKQDLWEGTWKQRFIDAGKVGAFQEVELEFAVVAYMNKILGFCKQNNVRSGLGLAFITACNIRGANKGLLGASAKFLGLDYPFKDANDEKKALQKIADLDPKKGGRLSDIPVQKDEVVRARKLIADETGLLVEDQYYTETYTDDCDK
jgi:hypothetical protein